MICPYGKRPIDECDRKVYTGQVNPCQACIDDWNGREPQVFIVGEPSTESALALMRIMRSEYQKLVEEKKP
jgi:hypothetical protein